jgi:hypothetical protein
VGGLGWTKWRSVNSENGVKWQSRVTGVDGVDSGNGRGPGKVQRLDGRYASGGWPRNVNLAQNALDVRVAREMGNRERERERVSL